MRPLPTPDDIPILHLDDDLVVVSKPAGVVIHRDQYTRREEPMLQLVSTRLRRFIYPVHRLDRNTSGILCFALSSEAARHLQANLGASESSKRYLVLVRGTTEERFVSDRPLSNERREPRPACTEFERVAVFSRCSLLRARLRTGRRHQIRRHLGHLAHQVIGDSSYGKGRINAFFRETYGLPRMFLHAHHLTVAHPRTGETLRVDDPLPDDLRAFLGRLPDVDETLRASL